MLFSDITYNDVSLVVNNDIFVLGKSISEYLSRLMQSHAQIIVKSIIFIHGKPYKFKFYHMPSYLLKTWA